MTFRLGTAQTKTVASPEQLLASLEAFLAEELERTGGPVDPVNPGHRRQFTWPKPSIAAQYHVRPTDFKKSVRYEIHGEGFQVLVAETPFGFFGRCDALRAEAKGATIEGMLSNLGRELEPLFRRQFAISRTLRLPRRFDGHINELEPWQLVRLLFCEDRDVAHTAMQDIDAHARSGLYTPCLIRILRDEGHPYRRSAQWCALDIFEDLPNVCRSDSEMREALEAICHLMMTAQDDIIRTIYKAGDVLGDHIATAEAGEILIKVLQQGKYPFGRRSAIHGMIHLCEWLPEYQGRCLEALESASSEDPDASLRAYARATLRDIRSGGPHGPEPALAGEV